MNNPRIKYLNNILLRATRKAPPTATAKGKKRKTACGDSIKVADCIKPAAGDGSSSDGEEPPVLLPQVSYPKALGYEGNGQVQPSGSKRPKPTVGKRPQSQPRPSRASSSKASLAQRQSRKVFYHHVHVHVHCICTCIIYYVHVHTRHVHVE